MGTRHVWMLSRFFDHFGISPRSLAGEDVLDAGCFTGGVSLVLSRLGARVTAIDEIAKYTQALSFVAESFGLPHFSVESRSIFDLDASFNAKFDKIFCLGVLYHLSDPIVGLRRLFAALKPNGILCLESMSIDSPKCICEYWGPSRARGDADWNWFVPSPRAIEQLLADTGFMDIRVGDGLSPLAVTGERDPMGADRCFAVAKKDSNHKMCVGGLSTIV
jgi:SAM-dependent methyltransferase